MRGVLVLLMSYVLINVCGCTFNWLICIHLKMVDVACALYHVYMYVALMAILLSGLSPCWYSVCPRSSALITPQSPGNTKCPLLPFPLPVSYLHWWKTFAKLMLGRSGLKLHFFKLQKLVKFCHGDCLSGPIEPIETVSFLLLSFQRPLSLTFDPVAMQSDRLSDSELARVNEHWRMQVLFVIDMNMIKTAVVNIRKAVFSFCHH